MCLDFTAGSLIFRFAPYKIDNRLYRQVSPICHHELRPNTTAWASWGPYRYRIHTDSLGFKDAAVREIPLKGDAWRVVLMGDSITEGVGYAFEETFPGILQARLAPRGIDVLNAGVSSYSPIVYYRRLKYLIEEVKLHVDEVTVFLDISDIQDEAMIYELSEDGRVVLQPSAPAKLAGATALGWSPVTGLDKFKSLLREHFLSVAVADRLKDRLFAFEAGQPVQAEARPLEPWLSALSNQRGNWTHNARVYAAYGERGLERAARSMELLHDLLRKHGIRLTVVIYPWPNQIAARDLDSKQVRFWRTWAAAHEAAFVDLFGEFIDGSDPATTIRKYYIERDVHFNAAGHQHVAEAMLKRLQWIARQ